MSLPAICISGEILQSLLHPLSHKGIDVFPSIDPALCCRDRKFGCIRRAKFYNSCDTAELIVEVRHAAESPASFGRAVVAKYDPVIADYCPPGFFRGKTGLRFII